VREGIRAVKFRLALFVAAASGFIALSYEILWYRLYSFVSWGAPRAFGSLLAAYLLGIAIGSFRARAYCDESGQAGEKPRMLVLARFLFLSNMLSFVVAPVLGYAATLTHWLYSLVAVAVATTLLGAILPLVSHFAIPPDDRAGARLSYLYLANILGSAAGSLLTGFVAMDVMSTRGIAVTLGLLGIGLASVVLLQTGLSPMKLLSHGVEFAFVAFGMVFLSHPLFDQLYERLLFKERFTKDVRFAETFENRSGVIHVTDDGRVWGGGAYDGSINTSIAKNQNWIVRAYTVPAMHPEPKAMLMIGLASGSWAEVLANAPGLEKFTIVEINPGYLELIARHSQVASILHNPKVEIVIDDGRRWLLAHPEAKFDTIVMNTSWHWRAHMSDLLSKEFLEIARAHMNPGGLLFYNTTSSHDVFKTALDVYPYALRVLNFVAVSDSPVTLDKERWKKLLLDYRIEGAKILDPEKKEDKVVLDVLVDLADSVNRPPQDYGLESRDSLLTRMNDGTVITDDNMACEWREYFPDEF
jgi:spermidine synthase